MNLPIKIIYIVACVILLELKVVVLRPETLLILIHVLNLLVEIGVFHHEERVFSAFFVEIVCLIIVLLLFFWLNVVPSEIVEHV